MEHSTTERQYFKNEESLKTAVRHFHENFPNFGFWESTCDFWKTNASTTCHCVVCISLSMTLVKKWLLLRHENTVLSADIGRWWFGQNVVSTRRSNMPYSPWKTSITAWHISRLCFSFVFLIRIDLLHHVIQHYYISLYWLFEIRVLFQQAYNHACIWRKRFKVASTQYLPNGQE